MTAPKQRWERLGELLSARATEEELTLALHLLVRRMFLSPRLKPVLQERLGTR